MNKYVGSIKGTFDKLPDITTIAVTVKQGNIVICNETLNECNFYIEYSYNNFVDPILLTIQPSNDDQVIRQHPITLVSLEFDDLYELADLLHNGQLIVHDQIIDVGNCIWCLGKLVYSIKIPVISAVRSVQ